jgi:gliding motility-associated protein GldE
LSTIFSYLEEHQLLIVLLSAIFKGFTIQEGISIVVVIIFMVLSAGVSAAETAFFSLKPSQIKDIRINENDQDDLVATLLQNPKKLLASIVIFNNFINIAIVVISTFVLSEIFDVSNYPLLGFFFEVILLTIMILFLCEILPKVYATQNPGKVAVFMAKPIGMISFILNPLSVVLINSTAFVDKRLARKGGNISMSELEEALDITTNEDTPEDEKKILKGIVNFGEIEAREIMKPRVYVSAVENNLNYRELLASVMEAGYSRIPVYKDNFDTVTGILYIKDLLPYITQESEFNWIKLVRPAFFVPENKKIDDLLEEFQKKKIHMAIVVDEYGGTSGIITLEDIIEEIVGEINDEFDLEPDNLHFSKLDDHNYIFPGQTALNDVCRILEIDEDSFDSVKGESGTLAGLILEIAGKIPDQNQKIAFERFLFRIESVDNRKINKIKVTISDATEI